MKIEIKDKLNLKNERMDITPTRVKVFIEKNNDEFILISAFDGYQLPGGHVEDGENINAAVIREVEEETGIKFDQTEIPIPFFRIERYSKTEDNLNKCSTIIYFFIKTNKTFCLENRNLTNHEKENNYNISSIHKNNLKKELEKVINSSPNQGSRIVAEETLYAYKILKEQL